jgi:subtilase family serine protease
MIPTRARRPVAVALVTASVLVVSCLAAAPGALATATGAGTSAVAGSGTPRIRIHNTRPGWAVASRRRASGAAVTGSVGARVYLAGRDPAGLGAYAAAVSDPASSDYGHYLTAAQVQRRFGPTGAEVSAVRRWLTSAGLRITAVTSQYVAVTGAASDVQRAFDVRFATFTGPDGQAARAPEQAASVPALVGKAVLTVTGLDTASATMAPAGQPGPPKAVFAAGPCSRYFGQKVARNLPQAYGRQVPWTVCGYTPQQLRGAYGAAKAGLTGRGVTVAIVDAYASPTMPGDANRYAKAVGEQPLRPGQYRQILPGSFDDAANCGAPTWLQEESLDVEAVHAMAPAAGIVYVAGSDCSDTSLLDALATIVNGHLADVVSAPWTEVESQTTPASMAAYNQLFQEGAAEGIGFSFASGDCGYNDPASACGAGTSSSRPEVEFPASSPWVTAVGGTSLAIGCAGARTWEAGWGDYSAALNRKGTAWAPSSLRTHPGSFLYGAGGGTSTTFTQPSYQAGVVPRSLSTRLPNGRTAAAPMREVPDVAADADPQTGFRYGETDGLRGGHARFVLSSAGGTSLAVELFAGLEADAAQSSGQHTLGFANPLIYRLAGTSAFHDVTGHTRIAVAVNNYVNPVTATGPVYTTLRTFGLDGGGATLLRPAAGYDPVTGVGSPGRAFFSRI